MRLKAGEDEHGGAHGVVVAPLDGGQQQGTHAGPGEDLLGDDGPAQQGTELEPQHGEQRQEGIAQGVAPEHAPRAEPLGPGKRKGPAPTGASSWACLKAADARRAGRMPSDRSASRGAKGWRRWKRTVRAFFTSTHSTAE
ncbi:hypothetical protein BON30_27950 [Cystobacter ferrugineus]|uniref:Uncharacterized protein n=1 Tax=Cystobacter ferrugineus TaxID=83449 RepID=A0A1L9B4I6_9BACT|nr:hypothetical protein BON30_27950 [Cystobacter ferrugineus]